MLSSTRPSSAFRHDAANLVLDLGEGLLGRLDAHARAGSAHAGSSSPNRSAGNIPGRRTARSVPLPTSRQSTTIPVTTPMRDRRMQQPDVAAMETLEDALETFVKGSERAGDPPLAFWFASLAVLLAFRSESLLVLGLDQNVDQDWHEGTRQ